MKEVTPKTYLIGSTQFLKEELKQYLIDTNNEEFLDILTGVDQMDICSFYAKLCYKSLTLGHNRNISKTRDIESNIIGVINSGHGCYTEDTEVFTQDGWKPWPEVSSTDTFATLNPQGKMEWQKPKRIFEYDYKGDMYEFVNGNVDLLVTPNHNMFACLTTTKEGRKRDFKSFGLIKAENLLNKSHVMLKCLPERHFTSKLDPFYCLLGFAIGDGYIKGNVLSFHIKRERKIEYLKKICEDLNIELRVNKGNNYKILLTDSYGIFKDIYSNKEKVIPKQIFNNFSDNKVVLSSLFDGLLNSDGHISMNDTYCYDTTSSKLAGQFQFLCCLLGIPSNISQADCYKKSNYITNHKDLNRCSIMSNQTHSTFNKSSADVYKKVKKIENWSGKVYCAEVPNHTLFVRRNGKSVWCGNSVLEHSHLNFVCENVSRIFHTELIRHRHNNYSIESGRYVIQDEMGVWIPNYLRERGEKYVNDFIEAQRKIEQIYVDFLNELTEGLTTFDEKKKATSCARRLKPLGATETVGFTMNLRAFREILVRRTSRHAEEEIRFVFNQIAGLVFEKIPVLKYGLKEEIVDGLIEYC